VASDLIGYGCLRVVVANSLKHVLSLVALVEVLPAGDDWNERELTWRPCRRHRLPSVNRELRQPWNHAGANARTRTPVLLSCSGLEISARPRERSDGLKAGNQGVCAEDAAQPMEVCQTGQRVARLTVNRGNGRLGVKQCMAWHHYFPLGTVALDVGVGAGDPYTARILSKSRDCLIS
jgi:hypothetical protein